MPRAIKKAGTFRANGWDKMIDGKRFRIHCGDLGLPEDYWTEAKSYQAAIAHWQKIKGEESARVERLAEQVADLDSGLAEFVVKKLIDDFKQQAIDRLDAENPQFMADYSSLMIEKLTESFDKLKSQVGNAEKVETVFTLRHHADEMLKIERARNTRATTYKELKVYTDKLVAMLGPGLDARTIDEHTVTATYLKINEQVKRVVDKKKLGWSNLTRRKVWRIFRRIVKHLYRSRLIELPRNLDDKKLSFRVPTKKIKIYDPKDVKSEIMALPERLRLYALLGLNCGMLGVDMATIKWDEIDTKEWRIKRKRTKTSDVDDVPEVDYKLWPITAKLLKQHLSSSFADFRGANR